MCGKVVDNILQKAAVEKSFDNLTIVMVSFKNLLNTFHKLEVRFKPKNLRSNKDS